MEKKSNTKKSRVKKTIYFCAPFLSPFFFVLNDDFRVFLMHRLNKGICNFLCASFTFEKKTHWKAFGVVNAAKRNAPRKRDAAKTFTIAVSACLIMAINVDQPAGSNHASSPLTQL